MARPKAVRFSHSELIHEIQTFVLDVRFRCSGSGAPSVIFSLSGDLWQVVEVAREKD